MKKFLSILLAGAFLLALTMSLTGCKGVVTKNKLKSMIEDGLKEKYNEEFECIDILPNQNVSGSYTGVCYPTNDKELMFEASVYTDGFSDGDYYPASIAARELSRTFDYALGDIWSNHFTYAYSSRGIHDDETAQKIINNEFTLDYFIQRSGNETENEKSMQVTYKIFVDTTNSSVSYGDEWDAILKALDYVHEVGLASNTDLYFRLWICFVPTDIYNKCIKYFEKNATVRSNLEDIVTESNAKNQRIINFDVGSQVWTPLTKEEYIKLREEVD